MPPHSPRTLRLPRPLALRVSIVRLPASPPKMKFGLTPLSLEAYNAYTVTTEVCEH